MKFEVLNAKKNVKAVKLTETAQSLLKESKKILL